MRIAWNLWLGVMSCIFGLHFFIEVGNFSDFKWMSLLLSLIYLSGSFLFFYGAVKKLKRE